MASIIECHFRENTASGSGGAIYVSMKSELKVYDSQFTLNTAKEGGSIAVFAADSLIENCNFTSDTASIDGGCISLNAADMTVKHSYLSGCGSPEDAEVSFDMEAQLPLLSSTLRLEAVMNK